MFREPFEVRTMCSEPQKNVRCLLGDKCEPNAPKPMTARKKAKRIEQIRMAGPIYFSFIKISGFYH